MPRGFFSETQRVEDVFAVVFGMFFVFFGVFLFFLVFVGVVWCFLVFFGCFLNVFLVCVFFSKDVH